jgi:uncharacterized protein YecE (DUF72 family)
MPLPASFYLGTSSWTAPSWSGPFYPPGLPESEWLSHYARRFRTVEIDATWYRSPSPCTVESWRARTRAGFVFAAKAPQSITHEKVLVDCEAELETFLDTMERLEEKLGPILLQFPYFKKVELDGATFLERLRPLLDLLPAGREFAVEVRNKAWIAPPLLDLLREQHVALALIDHPWMPHAKSYLRIPGIVTADFLYVRLLGDRRAIEEQTTTWDRLVVDRTPETQAWVEVLGELGPQVRRTYTYINNHYAGCAYESADLFAGAWG